ncbi:MAG: DUF481 domain-containing protein [Candidatus Cloacimonetes bacterium]|nr:DUF481 domain-containing protein [Candidatus Cloacimonadota bacterium]
MSEFLWVGLKGVLVFYQLFMVFLFVVSLLKINASVILTLKDGSSFMTQKASVNGDVLEVLLFEQTVKIPKDSVLTVKNSENGEEMSLDTLPVVEVPKVETPPKTIPKKLTGRTDFSLQAWDGNKKLKEADLVVKVEHKSGRGALSLESLGSYDKPEIGISDRSGFVRSRYDFNREGMRYNFYLARLGFSEFLGIKNSQLLGYGIGWVFRENGTTTKFSVGLTGNRENKLNDDGVTLASVLTLEHKRPLFGRTRLESDFNLYPNLEDYRDNFKADGTISLLFPISQAVDWKLSIFGRYNDAALPGEQNLDTRLMSSVSMKF